MLTPIIDRYPVCGGFLSNRNLTVTHGFKGGSSFTGKELMVDEDSTCTRSGWRVLLVVGVGAEPADRTPQAERTSVLVREPE